MWHKRDLSFGPGLRILLADTHCRPYSHDFVCDEAAGFYICNTVFLDYLPSENDPKVLVTTPTLVVPHGVFGVGSPESTVPKNVVDVAVQEGRDVRPDAPGKMVWVGFNAGPRHARVFGLIMYQQALDGSHHGHPTVVEQVHTGRPGLLEPQAAPFEDPPSKNTEVPEAPPDLKDNILDSDYVVPQVMPADAAPPPPPSTGDFSMITDWKLGSLLL
ncbi:hypothetical protein B0H16DRAFT_1482745 [Mycena metata]|uniref:Uncharacterized protein n=1 Tax=Mycena metata TaxID=1033252 RepID=A0AAD7GS84_9AGAR|nr:hypothetical protein B0H16DRAFT_1482745 [Mycena metata]